MTTITDTMRTVAGDPDNSEVVFFVPEMRPAASGTATVTMKRVPITPVNGAFTVTLDPGLVYAQIGSGRSPFVVPASGTARMGALIAQYLPPTTTPTQVDAAITAWLEDNPLPGGSGLDQAAVDTRVQTVGDNRYVPVPVSDGTTGQVLAKTADGTAWVAPPSGGGSAGLTDDGTGLFTISSGSSITEDPSNAGLYLIGA